MQKYSTTVCNKGEEYAWSNSEYLLMLRWKKVILAKYLEDNSNDIWSHFEVLNSCGEKFEWLSKVCEFVIKPENIPLTLIIKNLSAEKIL